MAEDSDDGLHDHQLFPVFNLTSALYAYPTIPTFSGTARTGAGSEGIDRRNTIDGRTLGRTMYFCLFSEKRA